MSFAEKQEIGRYGSTDGNHELVVKPVSIRQLDSTTQRVKEMPGLEFAIQPLNEGAARYLRERMGWTGTEHKDGDMYVFKKAPLGSAQQVLDEIRNGPPQAVVDDMKERAEADRILKHHEMTTLHIDFGGVAHDIETKATTALAMSGKGLGA